MLKKKRSRRMPALFTTTSMRRESIERRLHVAGRRGPVRHAVGTRHGMAASGTDLVDDFLRGAAACALALDGSAEIVDQDLCPGGRHGEREIASDATACAGDEHHLAFEHGFIIRRNA